MVINALSRQARNDQRAVISSLSRKLCVSILTLNFVVKITMYLNLYKPNRSLNNFELFITSQPEKQIITLAELKLKQIVPTHLLWE